MPGWKQLVERMITELHPGKGPEAEARHARELASAGATSAALRIAQEYEAEFRRDALERLIAESVPDAAFAPGELHSLLLSLPWSDVLTTNWDTLLERAANLVEDRVYSVVNTVEDIPRSTRPRIVKLHGSLPSHRPFIFTEEDFRRFPERFAPFVNLARGVTMENVLVLIGFSGDDPNFLYWSGWVRDQLGEHAPTIYLVGPLDLTPSRRKMLEGRRVQPVDLSMLSEFRAWQEDERHGRAVQWFLERLASAKPYRRTRWPRRSPSAKSRLSLVQKERDPQAPVAWPRLSREPEQQGADTIVGTILPALIHNRTTYPGWLIAPQEARSIIWDNLKAALPHLREIIPNLSADLAIQLCAEYVWLCDVALVPAFADLTAPMEAALTRATEHELNADKGATVAAGLSLLRRSRELGDSDEFERWKIWLEPRLGNRPEQVARFNYEQCLFAADDFDLDRLDEKLEAWKPDGDPYWMVRKAALCAEFHRLSEANRLSQAGLALIRQRTDKGSEDIASWSKEGYALKLRSHVIFGARDDWKDAYSEAEGFDDRQHELASRGCNAEAEFDYFRSALTHEPPANIPERRVIRSFDVGKASTTRYWSVNAPVINRVAALQALRFCEETGTPLRIGQLLVFAKESERAAVWLHEHDFGRALGVLLRSADKPSGEIIETVFSREAFAALSDAETERFADKLFRSARALHRRNLRADNRATKDHRESTIVEVLARIVVRLPHRAAEAMDFAIEVFRSRPTDARPNDPLDHLFHRAFAALPTDAHENYRLQLFDLQVPQSSDAHRLGFDPVEAALAEDGSTHVSLDPARFARFVPGLIEAMEVKSTRLAASWRMQCLYGGGALTETQVQQYVAALWHPSFIVDDFPTQTALRPWVICTLPTPAGINPSSVLEAQIARLAANDDPDLANTLYGAVGRHDACVKLGAKALLKVARSLFRQAEKYDRNQDRNFLFARESHHDVEFWHTLAVIVRLCLAHTSTKGAVAKFYTNRKPIECYEPAAFLAASGILNWAEAEELVIELWRDTGEMSPHLAFNAARTWLTHRPEGHTLTNQIWSVISDLFVASDPKKLFAAMSLFAFAYDEHPDHVPHELDFRMCEALRRLLAITTPSAERTSLPYDPGAARKLGAKLASSMHKAGRIETAIYDQWVQEARAEAVPETRLGFSNDDLAD